MCGHTFPEENSMADELTGYGELFQGEMLPQSEDSGSSGLGMFPVRILRMGCRESQNTGPPERVECVQGENDIQEKEPIPDANDTGPALQEQVTDGKEPNRAHSGNDDELDMFKGHAQVGDVK
jgi:hypothetical protein